MSDTNAKGNREPAAPLPWPHRYEIAVNWTGDSGGAVEAPPRPTIQAGAAAEHGGRADRWSPERLLLGSVGLCLMATFEALAQRQRLRVPHCELSIEGVVDKTPEGPRFTQIRVHVDAEVGEADVERTRNLLMAARRLSAVAGSLGTPVALSSSIHPLPGE